MNAPRVSIIVNIWNGEKYLAEAIASVLAQSVQDWEMICWDDQSSDNSAGLVAGFDDERIRYFRSERRSSLGDARRQAIALAQAEWLAFLDQDDVWLPRKLEWQLALAGEPATGIVYGRALRFGSWRKEYDFDHRHEFEPLPEGNIFVELFSRSCFIAMSSVMLRRSAVERLDPIPDYIQTIPDYYLFLGIARIFQARAVQAVVCRYREHQDSMTAAAGTLMHAEAVRLIAKWSRDLPPGVAASRTRIHETVQAWHEMRRLRTAWHGFGRLVRRGDIVFLLTRPPARFLRALKRSVMLPFWKHAHHACGQSPDEERVSLMGTNVCVATLAGAVEHVRRTVNDRAPFYISCANAYSLSLAYSDSYYRSILNMATFITADGMPVVWALRLMGHNAERVHNDDLFLECCRRFPEWNHMLVGGRPGQASDVAAELRRRFPGISIVGWRATPVRPVPPENSAQILRSIRELKPDIVWIGMGTPTQDYWMSSAVVRAGVPMVAVGSAFDLLAGHTRAAPRWIKDSGLQWLFRLAQEPRRLTGRYLTHNTRFLLACGAQVAASLWKRKAQSN